MIRLFVALLLLLLALPGNALSTPNPTAVNGLVTHGSTLAITGSGFGTKSPAAPLLWDDFEAKDTDNKTVWTSPYSEALPSDPGGGNETVSAWAMMVRTIPYRSTPAPHDRSTKYASGGHYQDPDNDPTYVGHSTYGLDVMLTVDAGETKARWFATWYYRLDPLWTASESLLCFNHKVTAFGSSAYGYTGSYYLYTDYGQGNVAYSPEVSTGDTVKLQDSCSGSCDRLAWDDRAQTSHPKNQWVKFEEVIGNDADTGIYNTFVNYELARGFISACPSFYTTKFTGQGIRSYSVGGYWRQGEGALPACSDSTYFRGDRNNFRYFDDVYIDSTFSRVMLCNHSELTRDGTDICEPQIPVSWSDTEITVTVNLGALGDTGSAYLFVYDSANAVNASGREVTIGTIESVHKGRVTAGAFSGSMR